MSFWARLEKIEKGMEKWHNRIYKWLCILMFVVLSDISSIAIIGWTQYKMSNINSIPPFISMQFDIMVYIGVPILYVFLAYTMLFTTFQFPIRFKGGGRGRKIDPPTQ